MNRTTAIVQHALDNINKLGTTGAWQSAKEEFSHCSPGALGLAFKIFSRLAVK